MNEIDGLSVARREPVLGNPGQDGAWLARPTDLGESRANLSRAAVDMPEIVRYMLKGEIS